MRKTILAILGVLLVLLAVFIAKKIIDSNTKPKPKINKTVKTVFTKEVQNTTIPIRIAANGTLVAKRKVVLYSEVQGLFNASEQLFKPGQKYTKGSTLVAINNAEFYASVQSSKSDFYNLLMSVMPDLKLDYTDSFNKWENYLQSIDVSKPIPNLPEFSSKKEQYFIAGKKIISTYYNLKNLEERLSKYTIKAPFNGVLSNALVTEGTLVRPGQQLGEFIDPSVYELEVAVSSQFASLLKTGKKVTLQTVEKTETYTGIVTRVNSIVDKNTQTVTAYIEIKNAALKEGLFLEAILDAKEEENAFLLDRNLLINNEKILIVKDSVLDFINVKPVYFYDKKVILKGIPEGTFVISKPLAGGYAGMPVKMFASEK